MQRAFNVEEYQHDKKKKRRRGSKMTIKVFKIIEQNNKLMAHMKIQETTMDSMQRMKITSTNPCQEHSTTTTKNTKPNQAD